MIRRTLRNLFSRPTTRMYPSKPAQLPEKNRGRVMWDMDKCIWCRRCEKSCPANAIRTDPKISQRIIRVRCIACNTCVEVCPTATISMISEYTKPSEDIEVHVFKFGMPRWEYEVHRYPDSMHIDPNELKVEK